MEKTRGEGKGARRRKSTCQLQEQETRQQTEGKRGGEKEPLWGGKTHHLPSRSRLLVQSHAATASQPLSPPGQNSRSGFGGCSGVFFLRAFTCFWHSPSSLRGGGRKTEVRCERRSRQPGRERKLFARLSQAAAAQKQHLVSVLRHRSFAWEGKKTRSNNETNARAPLPQSLSLPQAPPPKKGEYFPLHPKFLNARPASPLQLSSSSQSLLWSYLNAALVSPVFFPQRRRPRFASRHPPPPSGGKRWQWKEGRSQSVPTPLLTRHQEGLPQ